MSNCTFRNVHVTSSVLRFSIGRNLTLSKFERGRRWSGDNPNPHAREVHSPSAPSGTPRTAEHDCSATVPLLGPHFAILPPRNTCTTLQSWTILGLAPANCSAIVSLPGYSALGAGGGGSLPVARIPTAYASTIPCLLGHIGWGPVGTPARRAAGLRVLQWPLITVRVAPISKSARGFAVHMRSGQPLPLQQRGVCTSKKSGQR